MGLRLSFALGFTEVSRSPRPIVIAVYDETAIIPG